MKNITRKTFPRKAVKRSEVRTVPKEEWIEMPHAGHFICGSQCRFHLNTKVGKFIISTVGEYWPDRGVRDIHAQIHDETWWIENKHLLGDYYDAAYMKRFGFEEIGLGRKYETMVFTARKDESKCCPWRIDVTRDEDFAGYNSADDAAIGHRKMCAKFSKLPIVPKKK